MILGLSPISPCSSSAGKGAVAPVAPRECPVLPIHQVSARKPEAGPDGQVSSPPGSQGSRERGSAWAQQPGWQRALGPGQRRPPGRATSTRHSLTAYSNADPTLPLIFLALLAAIVWLPSLCQQRTPPKFWAPYMARSWLQ